MQIYLQKNMDISFKWSYSYMTSTESCWNELGKLIVKNHTQYKVGLTPFLLLKVFPSLSFELSPIISNVAIKKKINPLIQITDIYSTRKIISIVNLGQKHIFLVCYKALGILWSQLHNNSSTQETKPCYIMKTSTHIKQLD